MPCEFATQFYFLQFLQVSKFTAKNAGESGEGERHVQYLEKTVRAGRSAGRRVDGFHPREFLGKVPHVKFIPQLGTEGAGHLFGSQIGPVEPLRGKSEYFVWDVCNVM